MADLILRFKVGTHIVHETRLTAQDRGVRIKTAGEVKRHLASQLTIPVETICIYDSDSYLKLAENSFEVVQDLVNDTPIPTEEETIWYWSYLAEEPEEFKTKRDRCGLILDTAIEQVTTDMNLSLFGLFRKLVQPEDPITEKQWIDINHVDLRTYKNILPVTSTDEQVLAFYAHHHPFLTLLRERLVKRAEMLGRDMGLAVSNIHGMFLNLKKMEESVDLQNLSGPIGESDLQISVVERRGSVNCGLIAGIAENPILGPLPLPGGDVPMLENVAVEARYVEAQRQEIHIGGAEQHFEQHFEKHVEGRQGAVKARSRRQSLVENKHTETTVIEETRHHLVQNVTSKSLDFSFTSNLYDIQKVSGIFVNLKKERSECIKMIHQLETRMRLWQLREYLFHLRSLTIDVRLYQAEWKVVQSNHKLKRKRVVHISQGIAAYAEGHYSMSASTEYEMSSEYRRIIPIPDEEKLCLTNFKEELMPHILHHEFKLLSWGETVPEPKGAQRPKWDLEGVILCYQLSSGDKQEKPDFGIYLSDGTYWIRECIISADDVEVMKKGCQALLAGWRVLNLVGSRLRDYVQKRTIYLGIV